MAHARTQSHTHTLAHTQSLTLTHSHTPRYTRAHAQSHALQVGKAMGDFRMIQDGDRWLNLQQTHHYAT